MADLPERDQADTSFDTLYHLAKKLEVHHQPHNTSKGGILTHNPHKCYKRYSTPRGCAATVEVDLFPPDPELVENTPPEPDHRGIITEDDTSNESLSEAGTSLFCVQGHRTLCEGLSTSQSLSHME